jgi:tetratricopeptide (TPR) repeat protein
MNWIRLCILAVSMMLAACQSMGDRDTIAKLRDQQIEIKEEKIEGGLDKAMASYQDFLQEAPDSPLAPEAIRRLADLKIEKEYGTLTAGAEPAGRAPAPTLPAPERVARPDLASLSGASPGRTSAPLPARGESEADFEKRAAQSPAAGGTEAAADGAAAGADDLERASAREAIALYTKLLNDYPLYEHNDQVLYQMSRAYDELGQTKEAMGVMERMVREFPRSRYIDEVQFRRAEYFFTHRRYLDAEEAYANVVAIGVGSSFYGLALYKLGWTFYKQELYPEALDRFIALLDYKVSTGYDFAQTEDEQERKRMDDTFRVISLSFSNLGGANSMVEYFARHGKRIYEDSVYSNLGEFYFDKRRYADAAAAYNAFVSHNPFHKAAPNFQMRVIEIDAAGGFPSLVLDAKKAFALTYGLKAEYWNHFEPGSRPEVLGFLKTNLTDLANYYHASYRDPHKVEEKQANFTEALHWYREFLSSFPAEVESPVLNYQLADLLLEDRSFGEAAVEYEKTAYGYSPHEKSSEAGYAAVYAYRQHLATAAPEKKDAVKREVVRSSLKFADTFPEHEKAAIVLGAAADDLYVMKEYEQALAAASKLLKVFPGADVDVVRAAWLVIGHSSYDLERYSEAETAYLKVLALLPKGDKTRDGLVDNLAASIYKQGEQANAAQNYRAAADHFLRVGRVAPTSKILPNAEYDAAAALIHLKDWAMAAKVLVGFRDSFPGHALQPEVTKKIAYVYKENGQLSLAADEYERIERESQDKEVRRDALLVAAELHQKVGNSLRALEVYRRYVGYFPQPVELNLETRHKIAEILKSQNDRQAYLDELKQIVAIEGAAGSAQTPRTRYLAAQAFLVLAQQQYEAFVAVKLEKPFEVNLRKKRELMKAATEEFRKLMDYELGEFTAAATFYTAEIYAHFNKALMTSERPEGLSPLEREQYELAIEEQAYPFEEQAIAIHESNLKLISRGVYNQWIEKSLEKLAKFVPARYDKPEEASGIISSLETYVFEIDRPVPPASPQSAAAAPAKVKESGSVAEPGPAEPAKVEAAGSVAGSAPAAPAKVEATGSVAEPGPAEPAKVEAAGSVAGSAPAAPAKVEASGSVAEPGPAAPAKADEAKSVTEPEPAGPAKVEASGAVAEPGPAAPAKADEAKSLTEPGPAAPAKVEATGSVTEPGPAEPAQTEEPGTATKSGPAEPAKIEASGSVAEPGPAEPAKVEEPVETEQPTGAPKHAQMERPPLPGTDGTTRR